MVIFKLYKIIDSGRLSVDAKTVGWKVFGEEDIHILLTFHLTKHFDFFFMIIKVENVLLQRRDLVVTTLSDWNVASLIVTNLNNVSPHMLNSAQNTLYLFIPEYSYPFSPSNYIQAFRLGVE